MPQGYKNPTVLYDWRQLNNEFLRRLLDNWQAFYYIRELLVGL